MYVDRNIYGSH